MAPLVLTRDQAGVRTLSLNNPERMNALSGPLAQELIDALDAAGRDRAVRAVVLTGEGRGFCAGQDIGEMAGQLHAGSLDLESHLNRYYHEAVRVIRRLDKPVIAAVNGVAAGAGAGLALACDIQLSSEDAQWIQVFSSIALIPDTGCSWFLPRLVGSGRAFELMALAEKVSAQQALELGLCQHVLSAENFAGQVQAYAERFAERPALALALTKQVLNAAQTLSLEDTLDLEAALQQRAGNSHDFREGVQAFREKRPPQWER